MKILYLSSIFLGFIHYPIIKIKEDFNTEYFAFFFQNKYPLYRDKEYKKHWALNNLTAILDMKFYKIIQYWGFPKNILSQLYAYIIYLKISKFIKKGDFDIIHAHCLHPTGIVAYMLAKKLNIPFIVTSHGIDFYNAIPVNNKVVFNKTVIKQLKKVMTSSYAIIAVSEKFAEDIKQFCSNANVIVSENTYNRDIFQPALKDKPNKEINFLSIGFFMHVKNHFLLLKAFSDLHKIFPLIRLTLIGTGYLLDDYLKFINNNNLNNVITIKHFMPQHLLVKEYHKSDIFVLPSLTEPFGIVCLEALACGLATIASNTHGPSKIINDKTDGLLFESNNLADLKIKMQYLIENPEKIIFFSTNAIKKAKLYTNKHHEIFNIYQSAIESHREKYE